MTDKELLTLAAKAANHGIRWSEPLQCFAIEAESYEGEPTWREWNPRTDDGDAFRLAVKLWIEISFEPNCVQVYPPRSLPVDVPRGDDPLAATRLAIVRAAAEIGRAMP